MTDFDPFVAAAATGSDWREAVKGCLARLGDTRGANLGFLYMTDALAEDAASIVTLLRGVTGIRDWVGTVGIGICACGEEFFDTPALAVMAARMPPNGFRLFSPVSDTLADFREATAEWRESHTPGFALVHADPRTPDLTDLLGSLAEEAGGFLVGGLTSSRAAHPQIGERIFEGGVSGVLFDTDVPVVTGLTQGCSPIGPVRRITAAQDTVIMEIDGRPALDVFKEDIGELLAHDLRRVAGYIFAALPIAGSDTGGYLVRNLTAIDPHHGWLAIGAEVAPGMPILFTRRDHAGATADLERMLRDVMRRAGGRARGAVYVSCLARGPNMFGADVELDIVRRVIGDVPLAGFFANGEISGDRLYAYTGVLTLFR